VSAFTPGPWVIQENSNHNQEVCDITITGDGWLLADINGPNYPHCEPNARLIAAAPGMYALLYSIVDEFGGSIDQYNRYGPDFTHKDGTEVLHVSVLMDREPIIERARAILAKIDGDKS
jgi:hypothetical protein